MPDIVDQSQLQGEWVDRSIPVSDAVAAQDTKYVKTFQTYTVSNPHPGFGKDPNILNEFGHTKYPRWVKKPDGENVIVNNEDEEIAITKNGEVGLKNDGPTIAEYVARGYDPNGYPPNGYASKSSDEEIKAFVDKHNKTGW